MQQRGTFPWAQALSKINLMNFVVVSTGQPGIEITAESTPAGASADRNGKFRFFGSSRFSFLQESLK